MITKEGIIEAIYAGVDEVNEQLPQSRQIVKEPDATLFGEGGVLDSLGLVNLIVAVEQQLEEKLDVIVTLADEKAISQRNSPFRTVNALAEYVMKSLDEESA